MAGEHTVYAKEPLGQVNIPVPLDTYSHVIEGTDGGLADARDDAL